VRAATARLTHSVIQASHSSSGVSSSSEPVPDFGTEADEFVRLVEPLEAAADRALDGSNREKALRAWNGFPRGFEVVARRAYKQGTRNPVGLLVWMLDRRHHEAAQRSLDRADAAPRAREGNCFVCSAVGQVFGYAGQWWCRQHLDEQQAFDGEVSF